MATHKFSGSRGEYALALCGRTVRTNATTLNMKMVTCKHCQKAFAALLRDLPDVFASAVRDCAEGT
jgi:hypothetical protein